MATRFFLFYNLFFITEIHPFFMHFDLI